MKVQINSDKTINVSKEKEDIFISQITAHLKRFSSQLTRIETHFADENGHKSGTNDIRCVLEARVEKMQPLAVTNHADTVADALEGAIKKLKTLLDTSLGKLNNQ